MSQIASFSVLRAGDVPYLGFWSKPKQRFFRKPEFRYAEYLARHAIREVTLEQVDGVYVALVFAWLSKLTKVHVGESDPVIKTVRKNTGDSCWLLTADEKDLTKHLLSRTFPKENWDDFAESLGAEFAINLELAFFESAKDFVVDMIDQLKANQVLLISVS